MEFYSKIFNGWKFTQVSGQYPLPFIDSYYDYLISVDNLLIVGSRILGKMCVWDQVSYGYLFEFSTLIYPERIAYVSIIQRIYYVERITKSIKYLSASNLSASSVPVFIYLTGDDISISTTNNLRVLMNELNSTLK